jgi:hypothetical protein
VNSLQAVRKKRQDTDIHQDSLLFGSHLRVSAWYSLSHSQPLSSFSLPKDAAVSLLFSRSPEYLSFYSQS